MDQKTSMSELSMLGMAAMGASLAGSVSKAGKAAGKADGQFLKMLEQQTKPAEKPAPPQDTAGKDKAPAEPAEQPARQTEEAQEPPKEGEDAKKPEDPLEQVKRLAEQGAVFTPAPEGMTWIDGDIETGEIRGVYDASEYIVAHLDGETQNIPIVDMKPGQLEQVQQFMGSARQERDVSDPEADALLEATDPTVDHSPAKVLERVVNEQIGKDVEQEEKVQPQQAKEEEPLIELLDVQKQPEQLFRDIEAAPVKVGEATDIPQAEDVNEQIAAQIVPALEQGQTRVELQLTPEHLGTVKVEITQAENGTLHVAISAESGQTRRLLEKHSDSLQNLLAARSQNTVQVEVQRREESQPKNPYDGHNSQNQQQQQQQQEQHRPRHAANSQDFMHQLRLGLVTVDEDEA